jgi:hypothetical protein
MERRFRTSKEATGLCPRHYEGYACGEWRGRLRDGLCREGRGRPAARGPRRAAPPLAPPLKPHPPRPLSLWSAALLLACLHSRVYTSEQGLTLVHVGAQFEQLQDTFMR